MLFSPLAFTSVQFYFFLNITYSIHIPQTFLMHGDRSSVWSSSYIHFLMIRWHCTGNEKRGNNPLRKYFKISYKTLHKILRKILYTIDANDYCTENSNIERDIPLCKYLKLSQIYKVLQIWHHFVILWLHFPQMFSLNIGLVAAWFWSSCWMIILSLFLSVWKLLQCQTSPIKEKVW